MIRILFICHGNICRSPMAEFVFLDMAKRAGVSEQYKVASAATSTEEIGNPVHPGTKAKLRQAGISCSGKTARQITRADYDDYDLLIGMDRQNLRSMRRAWGGDPEGKFRLLMDYTDHPREVADPWYTGDYDQTYIDVAEGCVGLLAQTMNR